MSYPNNESTMNTLSLKKSSILISFFSLVFFSVNAQIQWANKVLGFSSERTESSKNGQEERVFRANQALGKPNVLPQWRESVCAWSPAGIDSYAEEYLKVGFENPSLISRIIIAENLNPGAIVRIYAYDERGKESLIHQNLEEDPKVVGRLWVIDIPQTSFKVSALKLVIVPEKVPGMNQIDAVGVSESAITFEPKINVSSNMPKEIVKENLGKGVNSKFGELGPLIAADGKTLFFTRDGHPDNLSKKADQDVWVSRIQANGTWGIAENLRNPINTPQNNAVSTISADGNTLYLVNVYAPDGSMSKGLSKSKRTRIGWHFPEEIKITDYYNSYRWVEYTVNPNGNVLVISCKRKDSRGERDLYVSFMQPDGVWAKPINMGFDINTAEDEGSPFIAADNKTLYFSTEGFPGYGKADIFLSRRLDSTWTKWSEPENLGNLINTPKWDGYFTIPASGEYAYLSSNENSIGEEDIFRVKLFPAIKPEPVALIAGTVINSVDKRTLAAEVHLEFLNDSTAHTERINADFDPETGEFKMIVPLKKMYSVHASKKGFVSVSENLDLTKESRYREVRKTITLVPVQEGQSIPLNNLFFEQSKYDILPSSHAELNRMIDLMNEYPTMEVLIEGHTAISDVDEFLLNLKLSQNRANEVKNYLINVGKIAPERIQTKGWGQSKPIASNATEETRKKNRRVEFTIIKL